MVLFLLMQCMSKIFVFKPFVQTRNSRNCNCRRLRDLPSAVLIMKIPKRPPNVGFVKALEIAERW